MRPKRDIKQQIEDAVKDFKTLVIYFNITRPQYEATFKDGGEFSTKKLTNIAHYLSKGTKGLTKEELHRYNKLSAVYNYTFGIPSELVKKVLGYITDENGKHIRIPVKSIVEHLQKVGFLGKVINGGKRLVKDKETGKFRSICHWR